MKRPKHRDDVLTGVQFYCAFTRACTLLGFLCYLVMRGVFL